MEMKTIKTDGGYAHIALSGRLDVDGARVLTPKFETALSSKGRPAIVDLTECAFLSSMGMRLFLSAAKALKAKGAKLVLYNPQPMVLAALQTAGFGLIMPIVDDFAKALELLKEPRSEGKETHP
jgi:anti-sigma B factor antagonist